MNKESLLSFGAKTQSSNLDGFPSHLGCGVLAPLQRNIITRRNVNKRAKLVSEDDQTNYKRVVEDKRNYLHNVVQIILSGGGRDLPVCEINKHVTALANYKHSEQARLGDFVLNAIDKTFKDTVQQKAWNALNIDNGVTASKVFVEEFNSWNANLELLLKAFLYLDRVYLLLHPKKQPIQEHGLRLFAETCLGEDSEHFRLIIEKLIKSMHSTIIEDPGLIDHKAFISLMRLIGRIDFDKTYVLIMGLEKVLSLNYYHWNSLWMQSPTTYFDKVLSNLRNDILLFKQMGYNETAATFARQVLRHTIITDLSKVLSTCLAPLLDTTRSTDLGILIKYLLAEGETVNADYVKEVIYYFGMHIQAESGRTLESCSISGKNPIPELIKLRDRYFDVCKNLLYVNADKFEFEVRSALSTTISSADNQNFCLRQFSKYCDSFFKSKEIDIDAFISTLIAFFKLTENKSKLLSNYERDLSKRLLLGRNFNFSMECKIVESLLSEVGEGVDGSKLKYMIGDLRRCYDEYSHVNVDINFFPLVLQKSNWPDVPKHSTDIKLPEALQHALTTFTDYYVRSNKKHKYQQLDWTNYMFHQLTLLVHFDKGPKDLQVNLLQATVILLFSEIDTITFKELHERTGIDELLLHKVVSSLSSTKFPLLRRDGERFAFNFTFWDKAQKIRPPMSKDKENAITEAVKKAEKRIRDDEIKAAVVRNMKANKTMLYPELIGQVLMQLKSEGEILVTDMKKAVEQLIEQEYFKRSDDGQTLIYIP